MKISKTNETNIQLIQQYQRNEKVAEGEADRNVRSASPEETVNLSAAAKDIQNLRNAISQLPDVRTDLVQNLQSQIEQGTYNVDGNKVLDKMAGESLLDILA